MEGKAHKRRIKKTKPKADGSGVPKNPKYPNLNAGGTPKNRGGGAPSAKIRELSAQTHLRVLQNLAAKAEAGELSDDLMLNLLDKCGKYGVGAKTDVTSGGEKISTTITIRYENETAPNSSGDDAD